MKVTRSLFLTGAALALAVGFFVWAWTVADGHHSSPGHMGYSAQPLHPANGAMHGLHMDMGSMHSGGMGDMDMGDMRSHMTDGAVGVGGQPEVERGDAPHAWS